MLGACPCPAEITTQMVESAELIAVGKIGLTISTGSANSHLNVETVLKGNLQDKAELVVVYHSRGEQIIDSKKKFIFFLKNFEVKGKDTTEKYQWMQFLGKNLYGLEPATDQNLARLKELLNITKKR